MKPPRLGDSRAATGRADRHLPLEYSNVTAITALARFDTALADCVARLGADAVCYSFIVADFHHLLLAGFAGTPEFLIYARSLFVAPPS
jgi:hypothetical protein